ncbi:hypothetical protein ABIA48_000725 [Pseudomonas sp. S30_BP2TU TE3576]
MFFNQHGTGKSIGGEDLSARRMVMADQLPALVALGERWSAITVGQSLHYPRRFSSDLFHDGDRSLLCVEPGVPLTAARIPERTGRTGLIRQTQLPSGIDAVRQQRLTAQAVERGQVRFRRRAPQSRVPGLNQAACRVEALPGDAWINRRAVRVAAVTDAAHCQGARINNR